jgi:hypothetical protein
MDRPGNNASAESDALRPLASGHSGTDNDPAKPVAADFKVAPNHPRSCEHGKKNALPPSSSQAVSALLSRAASGPMSSSPAFLSSVADGS